MPKRPNAVEILQNLGLSERVYSYAAINSVVAGQKTTGRHCPGAQSQNPKLLLRNSSQIASLDPSAPKVIMDTLKDINQRLGITIIVSLHQVDVAMRSAQRDLSASTVAKSSVMRHHTP
jgi:phosphonate transport system ATP-binding protein